ncbi:MAG: hypothetical protein JNK74_09250 [Candidatus Hydrogenedentes bacterium]|nr:hypothetical protein [Candidatus Hydrogenedentota bacterium]
MATIRDETAERLWGVDPAQILQWTLAPWNSTELAEVSEFILVSNEVAITGEESKLHEKGCAPFGSKGSDSRTYQTPLGGIVSIICIERDYKIALGEQQAAGPRPMDVWYFRLKYTVNLRRLLTREANAALACARLHKAHFDSAFSQDELWFRKHKLRSAVELRCLKRILFSRAAPAIFLVVAAGTIRKERFPLSYSGMEDLDSRLRAMAAIREELKATDNEFAPLRIEGSGTPTILDESGELICGVDPAAVIRWAITTYPDESLTSLRKIIVVAGEHMMDSVEFDLMTCGARLAQHKSPKSCTYALPTDGAVLVINIGRLRWRVEERLEKKVGGFLAVPLARLYYRSRLRHDVIDQIQDGLSYAHLAAIQRTQTLTQEEIDERFQFFRSEFFGPVMKRQLRSTLIPMSLLLFFVELVLETCRRNRNAGEK